jgi:hypothetical protein
VYENKDIARKWVNFSSLGGPCKKDRVGIFWRDGEKNLRGAQGIPGRNYDAASSAIYWSWEDSCRYGTSAMGFRC